VAAGGLKVPFSEGSEVHLTASRHRSYHSLGINFSIPVYTTVKGVRIYGKYSLHANLRVNL